jgi:hypothetical protein
MATAVIAACLPTLKPLAVKFLPKLFPDSTSSNTPSPEIHEPARISPQNAGPVSRVFNSLFSRPETRRNRSHLQSKYFGIEDGKIVQLKSRFSALSIGLRSPGSGNASLSRRIGLRPVIVLANMVGQDDQRLKRADNYIRLIRCIHHVVYMQSINLIASN